jgi:26S proteasome regulatory subunit N1
VIVPYLVSHNSEAEAVDLLMEVDRLDKLITLTKENNYIKVCQYLQACSYYAADADEMINTLKTCYAIYKKN